MDSQALPLQAAPRALRRSDLRTLALASLGGALEFYDFIIFVFFTAVIGRLFFPPGLPDWLREAQAFGLFAAGYLARPVGGVLMAHFGDRIGRKRMFTLSVFLMAVPTLCTGLLPTYRDLAPFGIGYAAPLMLLAMRVLQGAAIGGEAPGAWVFVAEHAPPGRQGAACGLLASGLTGGILIGAIVAAAMNARFAPAALDAYAWRIPFLLGGVFGLGAMVLRRYLEETPVFLELRRRAALSRELPLRAVLREQGLGVVLSMAVTLMLTGAIVVVILMTPTLLQRLHHIPPARSFAASVAACAAMTLSAALTGIAADRFGLVRVTLFHGIGLIGATYLLYLAGGRDLLPLSLLAGCFVGIVSVTPGLMVQLFPAPVRFTGLSFSYNVAYAIFGGLTPVLVSALLRADPLAPAHDVAVSTLVGIAAVLIARRKRLIIA